MGANLQQLWECVFGFSDVLHSVRAHESFFQFHSIWIRSRKVWFESCQSMNCMKRTIRKFLSYVQEYEDFDCNSMVFNDVLHSVHAHEDLFSFVACVFVAAKHGLAAARARIARSALFGFVLHALKNMKLFFCNSMFFSDVLYSVRAHENCFPFHNIWFRSHKAWFRRCQSMNCTKRGESRDQSVVSQFLA